MADFNNEEDFSFNKLDPNKWRLSQKKNHCPDCNQVFSTKKLCKKHRLEKHGIECPDCKEMILQKKLESHIKRCHTPINCPFCDQTCTSQKEFTKHKREQHCVECNVCKKKFFSEEKLSHHINQKHHYLDGLNEKEWVVNNSCNKKKKVKRKFKCPHCEKQFTYNEYLNHDKKKCLQKKIDVFVYSKHREKLIDEEPLRTTINGNLKRYSCDLHELFLDEAKIVIQETIEACIENKIEEFEIIHGYKHGQVLRKYFRSLEFIHEFKSQKCNLQISDKSDPGITIVKIEVP